MSPADVRSCTVRELAALRAIYLRRTRDEDTTEE
jgi:hypothetical protein